MGSTLRTFAAPLFAAACATSVYAQSATYTFVDLGAACNSASIDTQDLPRIGTTFTVLVPPNLSFVDGPMSFLLTGFQPLPTPVDIGVVTGHQPCGPIAAFCGFLFMQPDLAQPVLFGGGGTGPAAVSLSIPNAPNLIGLTFYQQNLTIGSGFGPRCVDLSRTGIGVIGT